MDIDYALTLARNAAEFLNGATESDDTTDICDAAFALADYFDAIDRWMSASGFLPTDWER